MLWLQQSSTSWMHLALLALFLRQSLADNFTSFNNITAVDEQTLQYADPYAFPDQNAANTSELFPMPLCHGKKIEEATIDTAALSLARRAYIRTTGDMLPAIAHALDLERKAGNVRGPLHGIPFMVKDNIATKDRMQTTAGSWALQGSVVPRDAHVVRKLRAAGALLLGKATLSEWADMRSNNYSEGYSARGGQCRSAYNLTLNPGGSSSGSAVGVSANVFPFALGTETDGSVINPAERNAVVGLKPTVWLTSRAGVVPESLNKDTVGVFAKSVREAAYALDAIYGPDDRDNETSAQIGHTPTNGYTPWLTDRKSARNATFGLPWNSFWQHASAEQQGVLTSMIQVIEDAGATIVNNTELLDYETIISSDGWDWDYGTTRGSPNESEYTYVKVDFYRNIAVYLAELNNTNIRSFEDIVDFNYANDGSEGGYAWPLGIPAFYSGQDGFLASLETKGVQDETYWQALNFCRASTRERGIDHALSPGSDGCKLDALLVSPDVGQTYQIAAQAGYPMITIPAGVSAESGMPFGLALMQTAWREDLLVKWASAIEDLMTTTAYKRTLPKWYGYLERKIPVLNA